MIFFLRFCRTWTKRYLITSQTRVKRVSWIHHWTILSLSSSSFFFFSEQKSIIRWLHVQDPAATVTKTNLWVQSFLSTPVLKICTGTFRTKSLTPIYYKLAKVWSSFPNVIGFVTNWRVGGWHWFRLRNEQNRWNHFLPSIEPQARVRTSDLLVTMCSARHSVHV